MTCSHTSSTHRYAINDGAADWSAAEAQVAKLSSSGAQGKSTLVSVKSAAVAGQKRKAEGAGMEKEKGGSGDKKARRSMKIQKKTKAR